MQKGCWKKSFQDRKNLIDFRRGRKIAVLLEEDHFQIQELTRMLLALLDEVVNYTQITEDIVDSQQIAKMELLIAALTKSVESLEKVSQEQQQKIGLLELAHKEYQAETRLHQVYY